MNPNELSYDYGAFALTAPLPEGPVCRELECIRGPYTVPGDDDMLVGLCKAHRDLALHSLRSRARRGEAGLSVADLSDDELRSRLESRGFTASTAGRLVEVRDEPATAEYIAGQLGATA